jgi:hypothetical protein
MMIRNQGSIAALGFSGAASVAVLMAVEVK